LRELRNVIENTFVFLRGNVVRPEDLPGSLARRREVTTQPGTEGTVTFPLGLALEEVETEYLKRTLEECEGNRTKAADSLRISRRTLQRRIKELGIEG
jgi:DNA-binding NtrC family response regulator